MCNILLNLVNYFLHPLGAGEGDSTNANGDETEHGNNHNYSQAVAHKLSALFVVLLFALNI